MAWRSRRFKEEDFDAAVARVRDAQADKTDSRSARFLLIAFSRIRLIAGIVAEHGRGHLCRLKNGKGCAEDSATVAILLCP